MAEWKTECNGGGLEIWEVGETGDMDLLEAAGEPWIASRPMMLGAPHSNLALARSTIRNTSAKGPQHFPPFAQSHLVGSWIAASTCIGPPA